MRPAESPPRPSPGWPTSTFAPRDGRTRLVRSLTRPPLTVGRVLYPDEALPDLAYLILANPTAGIFAGDRMCYPVRVRAGRPGTPDDAGGDAHPRRCRPARRGRRSVSSSRRVRRSNGSPIATIPFRGARFSQTTTLTVAPGGTLIYGELLTPGRVASGEPLAYTRLTSRLTAQTPDRRPLYREAYFPASGHRSPLGRGLLGPNAATLGTLLIITDALASEALRDALRASLDGGGCGEVRWGVAILPGGGGVCIKALGEETQRVGRVLRTAWAGTRQLLWGVGTADA